MRIICDTCIWYDLAEGRKSFAITSSKQLIATSVTIREIASSLNLVQKTSEVAKVSQKMLELANFILLDPFDYLLSSFVKINTDTSTEERLLEGCRKLISLDISSIHIDQIREAKTQALKIESDIKEVANDINSRVPNIKTIIKNTGKNEYLKAVDFIEKSKIFTIEILKNHALKFHSLEVNIEIDDPGWNKHHFYLRTFAEFYKLVEVGNYRFEGHDFADLFNLVYVDKNDKYWTSERKWLNIFKHSDDLNSMIYN